MSLWSNLDELEELEPRNGYISNRDLGLRLVGKLLKVPERSTPVLEAYRVWRKMVDETFVQSFAAFNYPHGAETLLKLQQFDRRLYEAVMLPDTYGKMIVAVGGGFSAGKSNLINSIIGQDVLPVETTPTTSVATYISHGYPEASYGMNVHGSRMVLDREAISAISHAFSQEYALNVAPLLRQMVVRVKSSFPFPYVILDTPGYSKSDRHKSEQEKDETIARVALAGADVILWVIDIERGDLPNEDIRFLKSLKEDKELFVVLNKADLKRQEAIQSVVKQVKSTLREQGISCTGVAAYSSLYKQDFGKDKLNTYLKALSKRKKHPFDWGGEFEQIVSGYKLHADQVVLNSRKKLEELNTKAIFSKSEQERELLKQLIAEQRRRSSRASAAASRYDALVEPFHTALKAISGMLEQNLHLKSIQTEEFSASRTRLLIELLHKPFEEELKTYAEAWIRSCNIEEVPGRIVLQEDIFIRLEELFGRSKSMRNAFEQNRYAIEDLLTRKSYHADARWLFGVWPDLCRELQKALLHKTKGCFGEFLTEQSRIIPSTSASGDTKEQLYHFIKHLNQAFAQEPDMDVFPKIPDITAPDYVTESEHGWIEWIRAQLLRYGDQLVRDADDFIQAYIIKQIQMEENSFELE